MKKVDFLGRLVLLLPALLLAPGAAGCDGIKRVPVAGTVLVDGKPLRGHTGSVLFKPEAAGALEPGARLDAEGRYELVTRGKKGAPPGRYRVVLATSPPGADRFAPPPRSPVHPRYGNEKTTTLAVEVRPGAGPGAYDLKLTTR